MTVGPRALLSVLREVRGGTERRPVAIGGARELAPLLARELRQGGDASAVREGGFWIGLMNVVGSVAFGYAAVWLGVMLGRR